MNPSKPAPVLLVDDEPDFLQGLGMVLEQGGFEVLAAAGADAAREILRRRPDLALAVLDVGLPDGSGYDLCRDARASVDRVDLPVLMISGQGELQSAVQSLFAGARDLLPKPFGPHEFLTAVRRTLAA